MSQHHVMHRRFARHAVSRFGPMMQDVYKTAEQIKAAGGTITREPGPVPGIGTKIVATTDPDGWKIVFVDNEDFLNELKDV